MSNPEGTFIIGAVQDLNNSVRDAMHDIRYRVEPGYESLAAIFQDALDQAQHGKGKERHATDEPFERQEICDGARKCGLGAMAFQVRKKILEAIRLYETRGLAAAEGDVLGAMNYAAAMLIVMREQATE